MLGFTSAKVIKGDSPKKSQDETILDSRISANLEKLKALRKKRNRVYNRSVMSVHLEDLKQDSDKGSERRMRSDLSTSVDWATNSYSKPHLVWRIQAGQHIMSRREDEISRNRQFDSARSLSRFSVEYPSDRKPMFLPPIDQ